MFKTIIYNVLKINTKLAYTEEFGLFSIYLFIFLSKAAGITENSAAADYLCTAGTGIETANTTNEAD